jgi:hypothetical protein
MSGRGSPSISINASHPLPQRGRSMCVHMLDLQFGLLLGLTRVGWVAPNKTRYR